MGVLLDEFLTGLNLIPHQVRLPHAQLQLHLQCLPASMVRVERLHGGFPELLGIHFTQTLVTLQRNAISILLGNLC